MRMRNDEQHGTGSVSDLSIGRKACWSRLRSLTLPVPCR